jgi:hypothetical protein
MADIGLPYPAVHSACIPLGVRRTLYGTVERSEHCVHCGRTEVHGHATRACIVPSSRRRASGACRCKRPLAVGHIAPEVGITARAITRVTPRARAGPTQDRNRRMRSHSVVPIARLCPASCCLAGMAHVDLTALAIADYQSRTPTELDARFLTLSKPHLREPRLPRQHVRLPESPRS